MMAILSVIIPAPLLQEFLPSCLIQGSISRLT
jgi:hypothetical protein